MFCKWLWLLKTLIVLSVESEDWVCVRIVGSRGRVFWILELLGCSRPLSSTILLSKLSVVVSLSLTLTSLNPAASSRRAMICSTVRSAVEIFRNKSTKKFGVLIFRASALMVHSMSLKNGILLLYHVELGIVRPIGLRLNWPFDTEYHGKFQTLFADAEYSKCTDLSSADK